MQHKSRSGFTFFVLGGLLVVVSSIVIQRISNTGVRIYPAKFVCGIMPAASSTPGSFFFGSVNPGKYTTSINIQNARNASTTIVKEVMLAPREPMYATISTSTSLSLPANSATSADCPDIYTLLGMHASSTDYVEGFLNVRAKADLFVTSVYTGQSLRPDGTPLEMSSVDIERIFREDVPR